jgi:hypothetical protein
MGANIFSKGYCWRIVLFLLSCSNENGLPKCDDEITLSGVEEVLCQSIAKGGYPRVFKSSLEIDKIKTVKDDNE